MTALLALVRDPGGALDLPHYVQIAHALERARFDALLLSDTKLDPLVVLPALASVTDHIGLVADTSGVAPYHLARKLASLDHLSGGRAGWLIDTADGDLVTTEYVEVVRQLWDSFSDKAILRDKANARYYDPDQLRTPHHRGEHFTVRGPLNISRPPQGHPVIFQFGSALLGDVFVDRATDVAEFDTVAAVLGHTATLGDRGPYAGATLRENLGLARPEVVR
ncbi:LLM class flavin-dependent oxidoreductase [Kibdelosporangium phytohabitans]|nr:LLM class flavin-dependent oxidoreductase [Kibdelosporangium phytohabitans]MBE1468678.1 alkanesulfonate monooxygenase SsuD/methylene tetrahydromethanopterin reductase-like flavin-dependent oxidoreductase (luciferase family) [Kibdelosporangium phytohabitans]